MIQPPRRNVMIVPRNSPRQPAKPRFLLASSRSSDQVLEDLRSNLNGLLKAFPPN